MNKSYNIVGIGNAIVDIVCLVDDDFLSGNNLVKGSMSLIDQAAADKLTALKYHKISSGGSVANSIATLAMLDVDAALIGKIGDDDFGKTFSSDLKNINCDFFCQNKAVTNSTAKSYVLITPDGERTMCTYLGNAWQVADEINHQLIVNSKILYIEGYLWDSPDVIAALKQAIIIAKQHQKKIAFTLSDSFCVARHREDFLNLIKDLDILFANEEEIKTLLGALLGNSELENGELGNILEIIKNNNPNLILAMTCGPKGAVVFEGIEKIHKVATRENNKVLDSTGAGDAFAAGFLYCFLKSFPIEKSAAFGNSLAGAVIAKLGARLEQEEINRNLANL